ncbi:Rap1a/Tai family immunity protein [Providencia rettgeri]
MKKYLLALATMIPMCASAVYYSGNELYGLSKSYDNVINKQSSEVSDLIKFGLYTGYVAGTVDSLNGVKFCLDDKTKQVEATDVVYVFLRDNQDRLKYSAPILISDALNRFAPCTEKREMW